MIEDRMVAIFYSQFGEGHVKFKCHHLLVRHLFEKENKTFRWQEKNLFSMNNNQAVLIKAACKLFKGTVIFHEKGNIATQFGTFLQKCSSTKCDS